MASHPPPKRARLARMAKDSHVTGAALEQLMREIRDEGLPEVFSRASQQRARADIVKAPTPYGCILQETRVRLALPAGATADVPYQAPLAMLYTAAATSAPFADLLRRTRARSPPTHVTPWSVVLYSDEVVPGNPISTDNRRKAQAIYWSIKEFGYDALANERCWFVLSAVRSATVQNMDGGMSYLTRELLHSFFDVHGHDLRHGITLHLHGDSAPTLVFAKLGLMISDESALKQTLMCKGASGTKMCCCCLNMVDVKSELHLHDPTGTLIPSTCVDVALWEPQTDAGVRVIMAQLRDEHERLGKTAFEALETRIGYSYSPNNIVYDETLDFQPISIYCNDWMHIYGVSGLFQHETQQLMDTLRAATFPNGHSVGIGYPEVHDYLQSWSWPRGLSGGTAKSLFAPKHDNSNRESGVFKCTASEMLALYPALAKYFSSILPLVPMCAPQITSFLCLCDSLDALRGVQFGGVGHEHLHNAIMRHLNAFLEAYGGNGWIPKHHLAGHLAGFLRWHGILLSCWVHERRHKILKRFANHHLNTTSLERGLMTEITAHHLRELQEPLLKAGLVSPKAPSKKLIAVMRGLYPTAVDFKASPLLVVRAARYRVRDVVFFNHAGERACGELWFFVSVDAVEMCCISIWEFISKSGTTADWRKRQRPCMIHADVLLTSVIHSSAGDIATVIIPAMLR